MDSLKIKCIGKKDRKGNDYYVTVAKVPVLIDLSKTVIHVFPFDFPHDNEKNPNGDKFGCELVIKHYEPGKTFDDSEVFESGTPADSGD